MTSIDFSYNWNEKLNCRAFTTMRLTDRLQVGEPVEVTLKKAPIGIANVVSKKSFRMDKITEFIAYIDTGYSVDECKNILRKMYPKADWEDQVINFYLLKWEGKP